MSSADQEIINGKKIIGDYYSQKGCLKGVSSGDQKNNEENENNRRFLFVKKLFEMG